MSFASIPRYSQVWGMSDSGTHLQTPAVCVFRRRIFGLCGGGRGSVQMLGNRHDQSEKADAISQGRVQSGCTNNGHIKREGDAHRVEGRICHRSRHLGIRVHDWQAIRRTPFPHLRLRFPSVYMGRHSQLELLKSGLCECVRVCVRVCMRMCMRVCDVCACVWVMCACALGERRRGRCAETVTTDPSSQSE